jgi:hypothetical protein
MKNTSKFLIQIIKKGKNSLSHYIIVRFVLTKDSDSRASLKLSETILYFLVFWFVVLKKLPRIEDLEFLSGSPCQVFA